MNETAIVSSASGDLRNGIRVSKTLEAGSLLEQLRAAYQGLGREERQKVKSLMLTLSEHQRLTVPERQAQPCFRVRQTYRVNSRGDVVECGNQDSLPRLIRNRKRGP
jgi:hypothetical protein